MAFGQIPIATPTAVGAADLVNCRRNLQAGLDQLRLIRAKMAEQFDNGNPAQIGVHFGVASGNAQALNDTTVALLDKLVHADTGLLLWLARIG